jgi:hypothetical protein
MQGKWPEAVGWVSGVIVVIGLSLKGMFISRSDCRNRQADCIGGIKEELQAINKKIDTAHVENKDRMDYISKQLNKTGQWITALAAEKNIKQSDLPNIGG